MKKSTVLFTISLFLALLALFLALRYTRVVGNQELGQGEALTTSISSLSPGKR